MLVWRVCCAICGRRPPRCADVGLTAPVDWVSPQVPTGSLRLWDVGVSWKEIETSKGVYDWSKLNATV